MKSHYTVEQFFHEGMRTPLGVTLALLRVACAGALGESLLRVHALMPDVLLQLRVQSIPFLEVFATVWALMWWRWVIILGGIAFALGLRSRIVAGVLLFFLLGVGIIQRGVLFQVMGYWVFVGVLMLLLAIFSEWGRVFGCDDLFDRMSLFRRKNKKGGMMR